MIEKLEFNKSMSVTPDYLNIEEWGYKLRHNDEDNIPFSYISGDVIVGNSKLKHGSLYRFSEKYKPRQDVFDFRLWTKSKVVCAWIRNSNEIFDVLEYVQNAIEANSYISAENAIIKSKIPRFVKHSDFKINNVPKEISKFPSLLDYYIIFKEQTENSINVIRCKFSDFDDLRKQNIEILNTIDNRGWHIMNPIQKTSLAKNNRFIKEKLSNYYIESCNMWYNNIGNLDIAYWHLLRYEE